MPIKVRCPNCSDAFKTSSKNRGHKVDCPLCGSSIRVSQRSRKAERSGGGPSPGDSFGDEIAAVLTEDDGLPPREFVPSVLDDGSLLDEGGGDPGLGSSPNLSTGTNGAATTGAATVAESVDPNASYDGVVAYRPGDRPDLGSLVGRRAALPFVAGLLVGAVVAYALMMVFGGRSGVGGTQGRTGSAAARGSLQPPTPLANAAKTSTPPLESVEPPTNADDKAAMLSKVAITSAELEVGGGLLGGGRTMVFRVRNGTGLVLENVTAATTLSLAAYSDSVLAKERVVVSFEPALGVGEEQVVRVTPSGGGPIANAKLQGPVRLEGAVVDLKWLENDGP